MAVPKKRLSKSRIGRRIANDKITGLSLCSCSNCGAKVLSHQMCDSCGFYKKIKIV